jgi:hypothetical protein
MGMRRRPALATSPEDHAARFAWWVAFLVTISLVAALGLARSAQASTAAVPALAAPTLLAFDEEEDEAEVSEDDEGFGFEACEDEEEAEYCEAEEEGPGGPEAPPECLLSSAQASVSASPNRDRVKLRIRYAMSSPSAVAVDYGLHGGKGSLFLGSERKQLGGSGVLRLTEDLNEAQMAKVMAAKSFTVRLRVPAAPRYCQSLFERQLDLRRATPAGITWQQSE